MLELESFAVIDIIRRFEVGTPPEKVGVRKAEGGPAMHVRFVFFFSELQLLDDATRPYDSDGGDGGGVEN